MGFTLEPDDLAVSRKSQVFSAAEQFHAVANKRILHEPCGVAVLARQNAVRCLHEINIRPKAGKGLRHLTTKWAGADNAETLRQWGQRKKCFVCDVGNFVQTGNQRSSCPCARGNDRVLESEHAAADLYRVPADELSLADEHVYTQLTEADGGIVRAEFSAQTPHPFHGATKIHRDFASGFDSKLACVSHLSSRSRHSDERLRGYTADVQAIAAKKMFLDECDPRAQSGRTSGRH